LSIISWVVIIYKCINSLLFALFFCPYLNDSSIKGSPSDTSKTWSAYQSI